jgi:LysR family transcriptional regulator, carnitine catabolism transcriptional activator
MDERKLQLFVAVIDEGSLTAAAARLHIAQPSASQTLRSIEREYGVPLFRRVGRGLKLTSAGEALVAPARDALTALGTAAAAVRTVTDLESGFLHIAALSTLASDPLAELIGSFRQAHSRIIIRIDESEGVTALTNLVRLGYCDLGLAHLPVEGDLVSVPLGTQDLVFVLPPDSPRGNRPLPMRTLAHTPLVVAPKGTSTRTLLDQVFADAGMQPLVAVETAAREAVIPLVLAGAGAALLPQSLGAEAARRGAIVRQPTPCIWREIGLIHRSERLSPAAAAFLRLAARSRRA